jgi:hypothetical protein
MERPHAGPLHDNVPFDPGAERDSDIDMLAGAEQPVNRGAAAERRYVCSTR